MCTIFIPFCCVTSRQSQLARATNFLQLEMGLGLKGHRENIPITFTRAEYNKYTARFRSLDTENKGYITVNDLRRYFKVSRLLCRPHRPLQAISLLIFVKYLNTWFLYRISCFLDL